MNLSIRAKILASLLAVTIISSVTIGWISFDASRDAMEKAVFNQLTSLREDHKVQIEDFFDTIEKQVLTLSEDPTVVLAMAEFRDAFQTLRDNLTADNSQLSIDQTALNQYYQQTFKSRLEETSTQSHNIAELIPQKPVAQYLQAEFIANNPAPLGQKNQMSTADDSTIYSSVHQVYHRIFRKFSTNFDYYDIFLVDSDSGDLVYSVFKEIDFATNLKTGPFKDSGIAKVFQRAAEATDPEFYTIQDFEFYTPSYDAPAPLN